MKGMLVLLNIYIGTMLAGNITPTTIEQIITMATNDLKELEWSHNLKSLTISNNINLCYNLSTTLAGLEGSQPCSILVEFFTGTSPLLRIPHILNTPSFVLLQLTPPFIDQELSPNGEETDNQSPAAALFLHSTTAYLIMIGDYDCYESALQTVGTRYIQLNYNTLHTFRFNSQWVAIRIRLFNQSLESPELSSVDPDFAICDICYQKPSLIWFNCNHFGYSDYRVDHTFLVHPVCI